MAFHLTHHAEDRLRQRGLRGSDIDVVLRYGTPMGEAVVLTGKDVDEVIAEHKRRIAQLERLKGMAAFTREAAVVTLFRPTAEQLRELRHGMRSVRRARRVREGRSRGRPWEDAAGVHISEADGGISDA